MNINNCINCNCKLYLKKHISNQKYCSKIECQNARRAEWKRRKLKREQDYKSSQKTYWNKWNVNNPDYWKHYRKKHPIYVKQNKYKSKARVKQKRHASEFKKVVKIKLINKNTVNLSINFNLSDFGF